MERQAIIAESVLMDIQAHVSEATRLSNALPKDPDGLALALSDHLHCIAMALGLDIAPQTVHSPELALARSKRKTEPLPVPGMRRVLARHGDPETE